ncbi:MAG: hypothetical protein H6857_05855 [Rhodospirillales bacterium]|nr:hypothetical protein [Rhodospirillales bacterium]MCB9973486.1 hypothetical protein [Rhodospirillales bacterium]MCB9973513.1 hypothetical protein [Rhodospirillales bacterium]MCB9980202.1 hypothetical protein [Rhodospirillales bacterium]
MDDRISGCESIFANDNSWDMQAAVMLGRFIALHRFRENYRKNLCALAISPDFFFFAERGV